MYALKVYANHYLEKVISPKEYACMLADEVDYAFGARSYFNEYLADHLDLTHEEVFDLTEEDKARLLVDYKAWLPAIVEEDLLTDGGWEAVVLHVEQSDLVYVGEDISDEAEEPIPAEGEVEAPTPAPAPNSAVAN
jgi:hypothetical protein